MQIKKLVLLLSAILIVNCAGTAPSVGEKIENQQSNESETKIVEEEVKVETFIVQEPEAPPLPVTVFEPYMIKRGDYLSVFGGYWGAGDNVYSGLVINRV